MEYLSMVLYEIVPYEYSKAIIEYRDFNHKIKKIIVSGSLVDEHLEMFARQENTTSNNLINNPSKITRIKSLNKINTTLKENKRDIPLSGNKSFNFHTRASSARRVATIFGVVTIMALGIGTNYAIHRHNVYNNQHVVSIKNSGMPRNLYGILDKYDDFSLIFRQLALNNYDTLDRDEVIDFLNQLDIILESNNSQMEYLYQNHLGNSENIYDISFLDYFNPGTMEYQTVRHFEYNYHLIIESLKKGHYSEFKKRAEYFASEYAKLINGDNFVLVNPIDLGGGRKQTGYNINNLSPFTQYYLTKLGESVFKMMENSYTPYTTFESEKVKCESKIDFAKRMVLEEVNKNNKKM